MSNLGKKRCLDVMVRACLVIHGCQSINYLYYSVVVQTHGGGALAFAAQTHRDCGWCGGCRRKHCFGSPRSGG